MSLECAECERDTRGEHDRDCSRYTNYQCECGHYEDQHDSGACMECSCLWFTIKQ